MRCLARNKRKFWYAAYMGKEPLRDEHGNNTGEWEPKYDTPAKSYANISAAKGETETLQFGDIEGYDKVIVCDMKAPVFDEHSILWIDRIPELAEDGKLALNERGEVVTPHDYIVLRVARSINSVAYAIRKVDVR